MPSAARLTAACLVIDILPTDVRTSLIARYVGVELKDYRRIFRVGTGVKVWFQSLSFSYPLMVCSLRKAEMNEAAELDNLERRFAWFKRMLGRHEIEAGKVFPEEWKADWALGAAFINITRCVAWHTWNFQAHLLRIKR